jgi:Peptidase family S41/Tricorn protease C1 domain
MKKYSFLIIIAFIALFTSCDKILIEPTQESTPTAVFEETWNIINEKYSFLEYKKINWDSIGKVYRPKVTNTISDDSLFNVLDKMLYTLKDGHVNIFSKYHKSRYGKFYLDYSQNFDLGLLDRNYLTAVKRTGIFTHQNIRGVGYIRYADFSDAFSESQLDYLIDTYKDSKGLIIDVRDNTGGDINYVFQILNRLTDKQLLVGKVAFKNGKNRNDFGIPQETWLNPTADSKKYLGKVVILTNRLCYSSTNMFATFAKNLPNVTLVGDKTGGGGGIPSSTQLSNGWSFRYSSTITTDPSGFNVENGVDPKIKIDMSKADIDKGKDSILEKALSLF